MQPLGLGYASAFISLLYSVLDVSGHKIQQELKPGRLRKFDEIISMHIEEMHRNEDIHIPHVVDLAKKVLKKFEGTEDEKKFANYYLKVFRMMKDAKTMRVIHDERKRLMELMDTGSGKEAVYAEYYLNILDGFSEIAADHMMKTMDAFGGGFEQIKIKPPRKKDDKGKIEGKVKSGAKGKGGAKGKEGGPDAEQHEHDEM